MDARVYRNPSQFYPERYMAKPEGYGEPVPSAQFGYGRR
jgi:cytochrome P450